MIGGPFQLAARHGRLLLVAGLVAGFALPGVAAAMKPWLPEMVAGLVFVSALRIGLRAAVGSFADVRSSLGTILVLQLAAPLLLCAVLGLAGWLGTAAAVAAILAMSAPSISGGPTFTAMLGHDPAPAMRLLVMGTGFLPVTVLPVFWLLPALGGPAEVAVAALRLTLVIGVASAAAFALRRIAFPMPRPGTLQVLDGIAALWLAVIVVGLMSAVGPALRNEPASLAGWLALAFAVNFGMQGLSFLLHRSLDRRNAVAVSVVAGNRNVALFLVALPTAVTDPMLIFIGCYQVPMYLTPLLLGRLYRGHEG